MAVSDTSLLAPDRRTTSRTSVVVTLTAGAPASRALIWCTSARPRASRSASVPGSRELQAVSASSAQVATHAARADPVDAAVHFRTVMSATPVYDKYVGQGFS